MSLSDLSDDEFTMPNPEGMKATMKALQAITNKVSQRAVEQQQIRDKLARQQMDLQDDLDALGDEEDELEQKQQELEEMKAKVEEHLSLGDDEAGGPEPEVWLQVLQPVQALPPLQLQDVPQLTNRLQQQHDLLDMPAGTTTSSSSSSSTACNPAQLADMFAWLLSEGATGTLSACPSEAVARITFAAVCYGSSSLALAAFNRFMAWCGEPEVVSGSQLTMLSQVYKWCGGAFTRPATNNTLAPGTALADALPATTIQWLPSADDLLQALTAMGLKHQQQLSQQQLSQQGEQQQAGSDAAVFRHGNLPLLLRLVARVCRAHAAGRLDASGLASNQGRYLQLLLGLLGLMLDQRATVTCRCVLPEAFAALLEVPADTAWDRLLRDSASGSLLGALSGGLGPSHRSAVHLLGQMPRSSRGNTLRQLGALQLLAKLVPKARKPAPPSRISSMDVQELRASLHQEVRRLLGPQEKIRALLISLSEPAEPGGQLQVSTLTSLLDAADLVLWVDVSTPGVGVDSALHRWFLEWLSEMDRLLAKKLTNHRATAKVAAMSNAYHFAPFGCVVVS